MSFGKNDEYRISLKFFSDDEDDLEEDDIYDEEEEVYDDGEEMEEEPNLSGRTSNPIIDKARKKAQEKYNESGAKDKINEAGSKAGAGVEKGADKIGDAVGGNIGTGIKAVGQIGNDKLSHVGDTIGNKIGGQDGNSEEQAIEKAQDAVAEVGSKAAGAAVEAALDSTGVGAVAGKAAGKATEVVTKTVLKSPGFKYVLIGIGILLAGIIMLFLMPVILLFTFGATSLEFITGYFGKFVSAIAVLYKIAGIFNPGMWIAGDVLQSWAQKNQTDGIVEQKLDAIYKEKDIIDAETGETRKADAVYAKDLDTNIPRERMEAYVRTELQCLLKFTETNEDGSLGKETGKYNMVEYYSGDANKDYKLTVALDDLEFIELNTSTIKGNSYISSSESDGENDVNALIEEDIRNSIVGEETTKVTPEGLTEALDNIPTAETFFAPLEESSGNPAIYNGENFTKSIVTNNKGETIVKDAEKIVVYDKEGNKIKETFLEDVPQKGDIITGNPPIFEIISPVINADGKTKEGIRRDTENDDKLTKEDKDKVSETFVLDVAKIVRGEDKDIDNPTTVTIQEYNKIDVITDIQEYSGSVTYEECASEQSDDGKEVYRITPYTVNYTAKVRTTVTKTTPKAVVAKLELWDRVETYTYKMETKPPVVEGDRITVTTDLVFVSSITTPTGKAQELHDKYQLDSEDFGIYKEITGMDYLCDANEYNMMTAEEYEGAFNSANLATPVANMGTITSNYGYRNLTGVGLDFHNGIDFGVVTGTECYSLSDGLVQVVSGSTANTYNGGKGERSYGLYVKVDYGDGITAFYAHLSSTNLKAGDKVSKGDVIGLTGNSGFSTGPHLHFEVRKDNKAINPMSLLNSTPKDDSM